MVLSPGQNLTTAAIDLDLARLHSTGVGVATAPNGGTPTLCTFDATDSVSSDVTVSTALVNGSYHNTRMTIQTAGEYAYGFGLRITHSAAATGGDCYCYLQLNGAIQLVGETVKAVTASGIVYVMSCEDQRPFAVGDYLEVYMNNNMGTSVSQAAAGEQMFLWVKRTVGP